MASLSDIHVFVEKKKREKEYEEIHESPRSPFRGLDHKYTFLMAMAIGKHKNARSPLKGTTHDLFITTALNLEEKWLLVSVVIAEKEILEILLEEKEIIKVAEEYANAGILLLYDKIFGSVPGDPLKKLDAEARDIYNLLSQDEG
jgi:hypothetical protein